MVRLCTRPDLISAALGAQDKQMAQEIATVAIGQALLDFRLAHAVNDDFEFSASPAVSFVFIEDEPAEVRAEHANLTRLLAKPMNHSGMLEMKTSTTLGREAWKPVFALLDVGAKALHVYKRQSAVGPALASYSLGSHSPAVVECDCKSDSYCFTLTVHRLATGDGGSGAAAGGREETLTLCADHSKKQEAWLQALIDAGVKFTKDEAGADIGNVKSIFELETRALVTHAPVPLSHYEGKVCLVVNISSFCGLTPKENPQLVKLYEEFKDQGFEILAFPCNQFGKQEPGTDEEIAAFNAKAGATYPIFEKINVNGAEAHPVYRFLKSQMRDVLGSSIKWNYTKFLCDRNGRPVRRAGPTTRSGELRDDIISLLATNHLAAR